jgi:hypothetical protein
MTTSDAEFEWREGPTSQVRAIELMISDQPGSHETNISRRHRGRQSVGQRQRRRDDQC